MATNTFVEFVLDEAQDLADYTSIAHDLSSARDFAKAILEENQKPNPNFSLHDPFMVTIIIRYARPFSKDPRLKIHKEAAPILSDEQRLKHEYFMQVRNRYIAHSVNSFEECQPVARYWVERVQEEGIESIECNYRRIAGLSDQELIDIIDLASTWLQHVGEKLREEKARLLPILREIPLAHLFENAPVFTPGPDTSQPQKPRSRPQKRRKPL
jgi:hypothetical protein